MKKIIRWHLSIPVTDNPHNLGEIKKDNQGEYVLYLDYFNEVEQLQARIKELESETQQTEMTVHEAQEYAWEMVKIDCGLHHVTVGELSVDYAFFLHGWNYATQYHKQTNNKIINEIKAQGIEEAIKGFRTFALSNNVNLTCEDFDEYLCEQVNKLRAKDEKEI